MKRKLILILMGMTFLIGLGLCLYPPLHGQQLREHQRQEISAFQENVLPENNEESVPYQNLRQDMESYNRQLLSGGQAGFNTTSAYEQPSFVLSDYGLNSEVFGILEIPELELTLPIYLGANRSNLALGAAHLSQTSLPIGGDSTNCVIAAHRGWQGGEYFLRLPELEIGDTVTVTNLWEVLTYRVVETKTISSTDTDAVLIQPDRELLTLLTCTYGAGEKYRYLVICERVEGNDG